MGPQPSVHPAMSFTRLWGLGPITPCLLPSLAHGGDGNGGEPEAAAWRGQSSFSVHSLYSLSLLTPDPDKSQCHKTPGWTLTLVCMNHSRDIPGTQRTRLYVIVPGNGLLSIREPCSFCVSQLRQSGLLLLICPKGLPAGPALLLRDTENTATSSPPRLGSTEVVCANHHTQLICETRYQP